MIKAVIYRNDRGEIEGFKIKGHAEFSESGSDIVCAAVSAIAYTALGGLDELTGLKNYEEKDGSLTCFIPDNLTGKQRETTNIILKTMDIGLRQIETDYDKYVRVRYEEV